MTESEFLTTRDLARLTGFSEGFIRAEIKAGALPARFVMSPSKPRTRGRWRIARADAQAYLQRLGLSEQPERTDIT